jgi:hypothetical protein
MPHAHGRVGLALIALSLSACAPRPAEAPPERVLDLFRDNVVHFTPDEPDLYDTPTVTHADKGRLIETYRELSAFDHPVRVLAHVTTRPIPKDIQEVYDKWDRAGNVRLSKPGMPDVEIVKFITAYGGESSHVVDVTHLAPLLTGPCTFKGFVDTWVSPGWKMDFWLTFERARKSQAPAWVRPLLYEESVTAELMAGGPREVTVDVPPRLRRFVLDVLVSGHCTDGVDADEFVTKDNVITVDGKEIARLRPWRDDCRRFRAENPYCRRWSDGSWSSDYSRSGWCPSDVVEPIAIDVSEALTPGEHVLGFAIENIRPKDEDGNFGYWRLSGTLLGYTR